MLPFIVMRIFIAASPGHWIIHPTIMAVNELWSPSCVMMDLNLNLTVTSAVAKVFTLLTNDPHRPVFNSSRSRHQNGAPFAAVKQTSRTWQ